MNRLKEERWNKLYHGNNKQQKVGVVFISDKIDLKGRNSTGDNGHSTLRRFNYYNFMCA
jgi:hypothetical protein